MPDYPTNRGWGPPGLSRTVHVPCPGPYPLHVAPGVAGVMTRLVDGIAAIRKRHGMSPILAYGAYNKRPIAGTSVWSNHSWGIAVDLNAQTNPYSYSGATDFSRSAQAEVRALCASLKIRWGLDYSGKRDAMHFEFMGTPADAARLSTVITKPPVAVELGGLIPMRFDAMQTLRRDDNQPTDRADVKLMQTAIDYWHRKIGSGPAIPDPDGYFGETTENWVRGLQAFHGFTGPDVDGVCGPMTWDLLSRVCSTP